MAPRPTVKAEREEQILEAAMLCFARKGYHVTTMDDIAAELPFSKGLLYYYFKTKRDLFLAILDSWMEESLADWDEEMISDETATVQLQQCLDYGVGLLTRSTDLARVEFEFYAELGRDPTISKTLQSLFAAFRAAIKAILDRGIASGEFRAVNTDTLAAVVFGIFEGLSLQAVVEPDVVNWETIGQELFDMVMHGLKS